MLSRNKTKCLALFSLSIYVVLLTEMFTYVSAFWVVTYYVFVYSNFI